MLLYVGAREDSKYPNVLKELIFVVVVVQKASKAVLWGWVYKKA